MIDFIDAFLKSLNFLFRTVYDRIGCFALKLLNIWADPIPPSPVLPARQVIVPFEYGYPFMLWPFPPFPCGICFLITASVWIRLPCSGAPASFWPFYSNELSAFLIPAAHQFYKLRNRFFIPCFDCLTFLHLHKSIIDRNITLNLPHVTF